MSAAVSLQIVSPGHEAKGGSAAQAALTPDGGDAVTSNVHDLTCRATDVAMPQGERDRSKANSMPTSASRNRLNEEEEFGRETYRMLLAAAAIVLFPKGRRKSGDWV